MKRIRNMKKQKWSLNKFNELNKKDDSLFGLSD